MTKEKKFNPIKALISYHKPYKWALIITLIITFVGPVLRLIAPLLIKDVNTLALSGLNSMVGAYDWPTIIGKSVGAISLYVGSFIFDYGSTFLVGTIIAKSSAKLRKDMTQKINNLPLSYFDSRNIGDVLSVVTNDIDTIGTTLNQILSTSIGSVALLFGTIGIVFSLDWKFGLILLIALPFEFLLLVFISKKSQKHFANQQSCISKLSSQAEENFTAFNIVKVFNYSDTMNKKFKETNAKYQKSNYLANFLSGINHPVMTFVSNVVFSLICLIGGIMAALMTKESGSSPDAAYIATIVACVTYASQLTSPLSSVAQMLSTFQQTIASSNRVFTVLNEKEQEDESNKTLKLESVEGNIEFSHVEFSYDSTRIIIHDFNEKVAKGQKIAIVGPTGAGKTTMVNLLMRFYDIQKGTISIENVNTKDMNRSYVRSLFAMVLQDTWLFEGSFMENLKFSRPDASDEEVYEACRATHCDEFIRTMQGGYNYIITGDSGLSIGQKQLLTIARAMIQNAPMLILDEATSSVDTRTELLIQDAMDKLMKGRTSFVIAHRLSTIKNSDLILVMKDGDVIESGNHEALMAKNGFYADLYNSQFANN